MRVAEDDAKRQNIRELWNEMLEQLGRRDINRFLRHMWVSKYGDLKSKDLFTALKEDIETKKVESLDFTRSCAQECESYVHILDLNADHLGKATPFVRVLIRQLDIQSALPMLLSGYRSFDLAGFEKVVRWILVFVVRYAVVVRLDAAGMETVLFKLAQEIRAEMTGPNETKKVLGTIKGVLTQNSPSDDQMRAAVAELILDNDEAKYLLSRLANYMQTNTKELKIDEANLEHIFPRNPAKEWKDVEKLEPYLWHIGNLTMLGERLNRDAANKEFAHKAPHYKKNSELQMAQRVAKDYTEWTPEAIVERAKSLASDIIQVFDFDNPSRV